MIQLAQITVLRSRKNKRAVEIISTDLTVSPSFGHYTNKALRGQRQSNPQYRRIDSRRVNYQDFHFEFTTRQRSFYLQQKCECWIDTYVVEIEADWSELFSAA